MYATTAAMILDRHRATDLNREVEMLRLQAERPQSVRSHRRVSALFAAWAPKPRHTTPMPRIAAAH